MKFKFCPKCGGELKEVFKENFLRLQCSSCGYIFYQTAKPTATALIVDGSKILLGKRGKNPSKGMWDIIGGFLEEKEHPEVGMKREVKEETGLDVETEKFLGFFMDEYGDDKVPTLNIAFIVKIVKGDPKPGDDIVELAWFDKNDLPEIAFKNGQDMIDAWIKLS